MDHKAAQPLVAIACGGTGGHLFPGLAVAHELMLRGAAVMIFVSPKEVDQQAVKSARGIRVETLPAIALTPGQLFEFVGGFKASFRKSRKLFRATPPVAVLAMGGFTGAPPILAGRMAGAKTYLHESNTIPGRANRWISLMVDQAFIGFPKAARGLYTRNCAVTGTPVRPQFEPGDAASARMALGLDPQRPVLLVMGGSQGATGVNQRVLAAIPRLMASVPRLQFLHLTGQNEPGKVEAAYRQMGARAIVRPFLTEMELALSAATVAISRAGASSLAELAAMPLSTVLIPYPAAADDHQYYNARAFAEAGAARVVTQEEATPERLGRLLEELLGNAGTRSEMSQAMASWHRPEAAVAIAETILRDHPVPAIGVMASASSGAKFNVPSARLPGVVRVGALQPFTSPGS